MALPRGGGHAAIGPGQRELSLKWLFGHEHDAQRGALPRRSDDDYDVLADGEVVGRIFKVLAAPVGSPWMWTLMVGYEDRTPTHGYAATREAAMSAFAKSWRLEGREPDRRPNP
jgi:hypothetical protein